MQLAELFSTINSNLEIFTVLLIIMFLDVITGCIKALRKKSWKSTKMSIFRKAGEFFLCIATGVVEPYVPVGTTLGFGDTAVTYALVSFFIIKEFGSIIENVKELGVKLDAS